MSWLISRALMQAYGSSRSLPEPAEEFSAASCSAGEPSAPLSLMPTPHAFSHNGKTTAFSSHSQYGLTFNRLTADRGAALLTWFRAGFPVRTSAQPDEGPESTASSLDSGVKWQELLAKYDHDSRSWKTAQYSLLGGLTEFSETWPRSGWMRDGACYPLPNVELRTNANASGFWPTPVANDDNKTPEAHMAMKARMKGGPRNTITSLQVAVKSWGTPNARDYKGAAGAANGGRQSDLPRDVKAWGTPTARDHKDSGDCSNVPENGLLGRMAKSWSGMTDKPGSLSPEFHLWLMGWPTGWTALEPLEMGKYRLWLQRHSPYSPQSS